MRTYLVSLLVVLATGGCAVHYFDPETGTEHIWGIGHMAMKPGAPREGLKVLARRTDVVGLTLGKLQQEVSVDVGWSVRQRMDVVDEDTQVCLAWPRGSFYNARIGSAFPPRLDDCGTARADGDR
jgi:hypothetical protein